MLSRWKVAVVTGLFVLSALSFFLGLLPLLSDIFWILWLAGCGACILALVLTVIVPTDRPEAGRAEANRPAANAPAAGAETGSAEGVSRS
ncbi:MAG: hypothetical protein L0I80_04105 [Brevibacterium sp.]|uniref:hypothetical protein n=1 Tax=Brevibacterium sp. TaxID=1701 RepID=UPI00264869D3|nr:hypothetical protein [Brevibacterium sp.]MDN5875145.1 hypothetical protein [Brevibacterium sp.]MDN6123041.1 hypothetical protein [Brevibacterium sp.]MDN6528936.1 hypothetical protein [Brevibacterium sp.]MDN6603660.1 hypothetical protein [Brevibacterium sp.]